MAHPTCPVRALAQQHADAYGEAMAYGLTDDDAPTAVIAPADRAGLYGRDWLAFAADGREVGAAKVAKVDAWTVVEPVFG